MQLSGSGSIACIVEGLLFMGCLGYSIFAHYSIVAELRAMNVKIAKPLRTLPLYGAWKYYRVRGQVRTGELDFLAVTATLTLVVGLVCWALIFAGGSCP